MRRRPWLFAILPVLWGAPTGAQGINLGWDDCPSGAGYSLIQTFACDTNVGTHTLVGSFVAPPGVVAMNANEIAIDMVTSGATLASWWSLRGSSPLGCRATSLGYSFDFTAGPLICADYWQGAALGGTIMDAPVGNRARIKLLVGYPADDPHIRGVTEFTETYSFKAVINNARTIGPGSCGGCTDGACIALVNIRVDQPPPDGTFDLASPAIAQHVIWQSWTKLESWQQCPTIVPVRAQTWGSIKALYR